MEKRIVAIFAFIIAIGASFYIGYNIDETLEQVGIDGTPCYTGDTEVTDPVFLEVLDQLMNNHYSQPDKETLMEGAIEGMIESLGDPHTSYFDLEEYVQYQSNFGESYVGIGVTVSFNDGIIIVEEVKTNGPADEAGIRPQDIIAEVDGVNIQKDNFYETIGLIVGDEGTNVTIGIIRAGVDNVIQLEMTRAVIANSSVEYQTFPSGTDTIGYIKVTQFGNETALKFREAIQALEVIGIDGLIVDLRNNGGGHLSAVYNMMNEFLVNDGNAMFSTQFYDDGELKTNNYHATNTVKKPYDIVTVVNGSSASASEVFSSGMQEQGDYTIIGTTTYGKGTMQIDQVLESTEGDKIHLSIGTWITSDGNWVHFNGGTDGVTPDIIVEPSKYMIAYKLFLFDDEVLEFDQVDTRVINLQYVLNIMGYDVREDGYFDQETKDAIIDIQTDNGITANGIVNNETLVFINQALDAYQDDYANDTQLQEAIDFFSVN